MPLCHQQLAETAWHQCRLDEQMQGKMKFLLTVWSLGFYQRFGAMYRTSVAQ